MLKGKRQKAKVWKKINFKNPLPHIYHLPFYFYLLTISISTILGGCAPFAKKPAGPDLSMIRAWSATQVTVGYSVNGWPLTMYVFGDAPRPIFIFAAIHGNEWTSYSVARQLIELLDDRPDLYRGRCVAILPAANPDGLETNTRVNRNGVDVNRNFPAANWQLTERNDSFGGDAPASEPETKAIINAVEILKPAEIISLHSIGGGKHGNNFDGPAGQFADLLAAQNGYKVLPSMGYPTPGSFGTWAGIERHIPTITLELPRDASPQQCWQENKAALLAAIAAK
jgi:murein peptide amidase A